MNCFFIPISNCRANSVLHDERLKSNPPIFELIILNLEQRKNEMNVALDEIWFRHDPNVQIKGIE